MGNDGKSRQNCFAILPALDFLNNFAIFGNRKESAMTNKVVRVLCCTPTSVLLVLSRRNHMFGEWELPGGKVECNEPLLKAARRELVEETGINSLNLQKVAHYQRLTPHGVLWHYAVYGVHLSQEIPVSLDAAEIIGAAWCNLDALNLDEHTRYCLNTQPNVQMFIKAHYTHPF